MTSGYKTKIEKFVVLPIEKIIRENVNVRTFYFDINLKARAGQFVMLWLPGVDQKPFAVSYQDKDKTAITVCRVGPFTEKVFELKKGDKVGLQGPFGTFFKTKNKKNIVLVAGGYGVAPLRFLAQTNPKAKIYFIVGVKNKKSLLLSRRGLGKNVVFQPCTEDGSCGSKGYATDKLKEMIKKKKIDLVCSCGPELMQFSLVEICQQNKTPCQISLERYIKCGIGLCGHCVVDPIGLRMCKEGPVISGKIATQISEFGKYHRDGLGKKINF